MIISNSSYIDLSQKYYSHSFKSHYLTKATLNAIF